MAAARQDTEQRMAVQYKNIDISTAWAPPDKDLLPSTICWCCYCIILMYLCIAPFQDPEFKHGYGADKVPKSIIMFSK